MDTIQSLKTILITGANRGIGFGLIKKLLEKNLSQKTLTNFPFKIIFTTRSEEKGSEALNNLKTSLNLNTVNLEENLIHIPLDITSQSSIESLTNQLNQRQLKIDILINNAGVYDKKDPTSLKTFEYTFATNVFGTVKFTEKILSENLLNKNAKIMLVASELGNLNYLSSEKLKAEFKQESENKQIIFDLAEKFKNAILTDSIVQEGWMPDSYFVSKMLVNKYARILVHYPSVEANGIQVYSCTPGWVRTDMGGENAPLGIEEGVVTLVYLVELEHKVNKQMQGMFIRECKITDCGL